MMLPLDDPRWDELQGGYAEPYNPRPTIRALLAGAEQTPIWEEFWEELHHQGDIGNVAYAVVPYLVQALKSRTDLNGHVYAILATIEIERHRRTNPPIPPELENTYRFAWSDLEHLALRDFAKFKDPLESTQALAVLALSRGLVRAGVILAHFTDNEHRKLLDEYLSWSTLYRFD